MAPAPQEMTAVRIIEHKEALEIAQRLINSAFGNDNRARFSIPCRPHHDDDCLIMAYIAQREMEREHLTAAETARAAAEAEAARLREVAGDAASYLRDHLELMPRNWETRKPLIDLIHKLDTLTKEPSHGK